MPEIHLKSVRILRELNDLQPPLYEILVSLLERFWPDASKPARIRCIFRTAAEEAIDGGKSGIHCAGPPHRAVDIGAKEFSDAEIAAAAKLINDRWIYDPLRPAMLVCFVAPHGTGPHFHVQVHRNTRKR